MGRRRPTWTVERYDAAIQAISQRRAVLSIHDPRPPEDLHLQMANEALRYERHLMLRRSSKA